MRLSEEETHTALWIKLAKHYNNELAMLREQNETYLAHENRLILVTRIREIKNFLALGEPAPDTVIDDNYIPV